MKATIQTLRDAGYRIVSAGKGAWSVSYPTADGVYSCRRVEREELLRLARFVKEAK